MDAPPKLARLAENEVSHWLQAEVEPEQSWAELRSLSNASSNMLRATEAQGSQVAIDQAVREKMNSGSSPARFKRPCGWFAPTQPATNKCVCARQHN